MNTIRIQGHLLATSFWHVTEEVRDNETKVMRAKIIAGAHTDDGRAPDTPPLIAEVPLVPSNSIRGRLHRASLAILTEALISRGEFISREAYQMLSNGGLVGGGAGNILSVGEILAARKHVHFGLWGGGPRLMPSSVVTCDLLPVCAETLASGRVPDSFKDFAPMIQVTIGEGDRQTTERQIAPAWRLLSKRIFKRNDDMMTLNSQALTRLGVLGEDAEQQIAEYQAEQVGKREDRKSAKESTEGMDVRTLSDDMKASLKKTDITNFLTMEVVSPGTVWPVDLRLNATSTPAQIALFARSVEHFANEQRIGSFGRWGFGQFRAHLTVTKEGEVIGTIRFNESTGNHELVFSDPSFDEALQADLRAVTGAEINTWAKAVVKAAPSPTGKRSKATAATTAEQS